MSFNKNLRRGRSWNNFEKSVIRVFYQPLKPFFHPTINFFKYLWAFITIQHLHSLSFKYRITTSVVKFLSSLSPSHSLTLLPSSNFFVRFFFHFYQSICRCTLNKFLCRERRKAKTPAPPMDLIKNFSTRKFAQCETVPIFKLQLNVLYIIFCVQMFSLLRYISEKIITEIVFWSCNRFSLR